MRVELLGIAGALCLIALAATFSLKNNHKIHRDLVIGSFRNIIQLLALGVILTWIFSHASPTVSIVAVLVMTMNAAIHSRGRIKSKYEGVFLDQLLATCLSIWPLTLIGTTLLGTGPWWEPSTFLPITGMLLGNSLSGISIGVDHFTHELREKKDVVITWIALGATPKEATSELIQRSIYLAMGPTINAMVTMGLVSIPGMMTGQILAGLDPLKASLTQMVLMMLMAVGTYAGTYIGIKLARGKLINSSGQLCFQ